MYKKTAYSIKTNTKAFHSSCIRCASSSESAKSFELIKQEQLKQAKLNNRDNNSALNAYRYFKYLQETPNPILSSEYRQLPDDSQFITKHYDELVVYRDRICGIDGRYNDLNDVSELFLQLSKIHPFKNVGTIVNDTHKELIQLQTDTFDQFVVDLVQTLKLNGGHLFVLDLLIDNKRVFDHIDDTHTTV